jgi:hypothetical protein
LVVIAIIALLIGILLPALGRAKLNAKAVKEMALCKQMLQGWHQYADTYKDAVIPGYLNWTWAHPHAGRVNMMPPDPTDPLRRMEGDAIKSWPWRFVALTEFPAEAMQADAGTMSDFRSRSQTPTGNSGNPPTNLYDAVDKYQYAIAKHPTFGLNSYYVGGHRGGNAFPNGNANGDGGHPASMGGRYYVQRIAQIRKSDWLTIFGAGREKDVKSSGSRTATGYTGHPVPMAVGDPFVPGTNHIFAPVAVPSSVANPIGGVRPGNWVASNKFDPKQPSTAWGNFYPKYFDKGVVGMADGHSELRSIEQMRDMRRWSNYARSADWTFQPGP